MYPAPPSALNYLVTGERDVSGRSSEKNGKGTQRKNGFRKFSGDWEGFVDIVLNSEDKERLSQTEPEDYPDFMAWFEELLSDGYKLSITRDETHACDIATITGKGQGCVNAGYSLSARGPGLAGSLLVLYFKHVVLCEGGRWSGHERVSSDQLSLWS